MSTEGRFGKETIENGLRNVQSFLRSKAPFPLGPLGKSKDSKDSSIGSTTASSNPTSPHVQSPRERSTSAKHLSAPVDSKADTPRSASLEAPMASMDLRSSTDSSSQPAPSRPAPRPVSEHRMKKFQKILAEPVVDIDALRELSWSGVPPELRPVCWKLLLGYLPPNQSRQVLTISRKRREYQDMVPEYYDISNAERSEDELGALRQVAVDVPRTAPSVAFFHEPPIQRSLQRMLYIWGIRHPASGYVQGMNDLVTPFLAVFLSEHLSGDMDAWTPDQLTEEVMLEVEADCYWCLCRMLEGIQDHYTYSQPGIQRTVFRVRELIMRIDEPLGQHLDAQSVDFLQFAFRWVNCLLVREVPFLLGVRLWDTYLAEGDRFPDFLVYLCASFLNTWSEQLVKMDFQDLLLMLQKLPTQEWDEQQLELVLSRAYIWRASFGQAQSHLKS